MAGVKKFKLSFVWYFDRASEIYPNWRDGLRAALEYIAIKDKVIWYFDRQIPDPQDVGDALLFWDDSNSAFFNELDKYHCKKGIILTTDPHNIENLRKLDVVFCESQPVYEKVRMHGIRAVLAFGTDFFFFKPDPGVGRDLEYFYPATFSPWKRQSEIARLGSNLLCLGTVQPDGMEELEACKRYNVQLKIGYFPAKDIRDFYLRAKHVPIPAIHGSERTVLEAMSMNIVPTVNPKNVRACSYIEEYREAKVLTPRDFIERFYHHKLYAEKILNAFF